MITNYYTLFHLAADLDRTLSRTVCEEIFCQNKNELLLNCADSGSAHTLVINCDPSRNYLFLRSPVRRAKKNSVDVFPDFAGSTLASVTIHPSDREITIQSTEGKRLVIQMFRTKANVLFVNDQQLIVESFLNSREIAGTKLVERPEEIVTSPITVSFLQRHVQTIGAVLASAAIRKALPSFDALLTKEAFHRANISDQRMAAELTAAELESLAATLSLMVAALKSSPTPRIYYDGPIPTAFSILPLFHLEYQREEKFESLHTAIRTYVSTDQKQTTVSKEKDAILRFLDQNTARAQRTLEKMAAETTSLERAASYETMGKLLMAHLTDFAKGQKFFETENLFSPARETLRIPLEPDLSPTQNAQRYFDKARKARVAVQEKLGQRKEIEERWEQLRMLREELEPLISFDRFQEFLSSRDEQLAELGFQTHAKKGKETAPEVPFRVFTVAGGFQVWAGKSSENNDLLTMKYAKAHDLWFHARGSSGSHVVLKQGTGKGEVSRRAIEQAASIAAYYSRMKTSKTVPVAMTERKYVRKPKGAPVGTVTIEREKLLFVEPKLPDEEKQKN